MLSYTAIQMIGTQRSGSNLLRLMLNQLPELSAPHPPHIIERFMHLLPAYGDLFIEANFKALAEDVCKLVDYNPVPWQGITLYADEVVARCKQPLLTELSRVIYEMKAAADGARIWMCKSMANIHHAWELEATVKPLYLFLYRDGRDVACSFKKAIVGEKHVYAIAKQWKLEQDLCIALQQQLGSERVIAVSYEQLLAYPEQELRKICSFAGITYQPNCLDYYQSREAKCTASSGAMWQNVERNIIHSNYNKYLQELSSEDIKIFEQVAGNTLKALGYHLQFPKIAGQCFTDEEVEYFDTVNTQLKQEARARQTPGDAEKRKRQDALLQDIKARMAEVV